MSFIVHHKRRRTLRRDVRAHCKAVELEAFRLIGGRILDLSPRGALVACDVPVASGDRVFVSFRAPKGGPFIDAEAEVTRVQADWRTLSYCAGLRFVYLERASRDELLVRLAGVPPPVPGRPYIDYAETVRRIATSV